MSFSTAMPSPPSGQTTSEPQADPTPEPSVTPELEPAAGEWVVKGASGMTEHVAEPRGAEFFMRTVTPDAARAALGALAALRRSHA
jgi:hypothetical protein